MEVELISITTTTQTSEAVNGETLNRALFDLMDDL